ncbi:MAG: hypothetical protein QXY40_03780 [Candidatus Methanomethylicia archaeon]
MDEHLKIAEKYLEEAFRLLSIGDLYDAAEKIWASIWHSTIILTSRYLGLSEPPKGITWREFLTEAFIKAGLSGEEAYRLASYYIEVRKTLHGDCFYGRNYEEKEHKPLMDKAEEYINTIRKLIVSKS